MSGNPYGLSEISHFGSFQRVGGKAGGFINKKFFHPSTLRNQEKLWKAQTADEREQKKQLELEKRRDEERQIEMLRKEMYLAGQGKASDFASSKPPEEQTPRKGDGDQSERLAFLEQEKRRRNMLKQQRADEGNTSEASKQLTASRYTEDVHKLGHTTVWGSWYSVESGSWGYACCQGVTRGSKCVHAKEAAATESGNSKKRDASLINSKFIEAGERKRNEKHRRQEQLNDRSQGSEYLADLLQDPALA